jgi:hypothetical protein
MLTTNATTHELKYTTVNFLNNLPKSSINLAIRLRSEIEGIFVEFNHPVIKIYKK